MLFFSARAWSISLKLAKTASNSEDEFIVAASELLKCGWSLERSALAQCKEVLDKKILVAQDEILHHLGQAWAKYNQQAFAESWHILQVQVVGSALLTCDPPSKSVLVLQSQAYVLQSLLAIIPCELSGIRHSCDVGPIPAAFKAAHAGYSALKCYSASALHNGWDFHGQEWYVLHVFLSSAIHLARLYSYSAAPREARFFLKQALNASQKHVLVLR